MDQHYYDYGPLLKALRGKEWVLKPHVIDVVDNRAKANVFRVPGGYAVPVTFGGAASSARVSLCNLDNLSGKAAVIHPGETDWAQLAVQKQDETIILDVPLARGCAMVKVQ